MLVKALKYIMRFLCNTFVTKKLNQLAVLYLSWWEAQPPSKYLQIQAGSLPSSGLFYSFSLVCSILFPPAISLYYTFVCVQNNLKKYCTDLDGISGQRGYQDKKQITTFWWWSEALSGIASVTLFCLGGGFSAFCSVHCCTSIKEVIVFGLFVCLSVCKMKNLGIKRGNSTANLHNSEADFMNRPSKLKYCICCWYCYNGIHAWAV